MCASVPEWWWCVCVCARARAYLNGSVCVCVHVPIIVHDENDFSSVTACVQVVQCMVQCTGGSMHGQFNVRVVQCTGSSMRGWFFWPGASFGVMFTHPPTNPPTNSLTHSLTHARINTLTDSVTHSVTQSLTHPNHSTARPRTLITRPITHPP